MNRINGNMRDKNENKSKSECKTLEIIIASVIHTYKHTSHYYIERHNLIHRNTNST